MKNKWLKILLWVAGLLVIYLLGAHYFIYKTIGMANLPASDNRHEYIINPDRQPGRGLVYAALGDSLTSGVGTDRYEQSYPYLLAQKMAGSDKKATHLNFSYPGARTEDLIRDLLAQAIDEQPDVITLLIGTNDVHGNVGEKKFADNYQHILLELTSKTRAKINIISIPYIGADDLLIEPYKAYYHGKIDKFNEDIKFLADRYHLRFIDLTTPTAGPASGASGYYALDNFHPSSTGYKLWADIIYEHLDQ